MIEKIEILREFNFSELCSRLRRVSLRGFPDIKIYEDAEINVNTFRPEQVKTDLFIPQPSVYKPELEKVARVEELFLKKGINIFKLNGGVDYIALENSQESEWTIIPPVIEVLPIKFGSSKGLDYLEFIGEEVRKVMEGKNYQLNPELQHLDFPAYARFRGKKVKVPEICDGSHRIELAVRRSLEQNLLFVDSPKQGFPYYAAPKPYSAIHEEAERIEEKLDKTHVLTAPGHKILYRLFPSGGINSGNLRPRKQKVD